MITLPVPVPCDVLVALVIGLRDMLELYEADEKYSFEDKLTIETSRKRLNVYEQWAKNKVKGGEE